MLVFATVPKENDMGEVWEMVTEDGKWIMEGMDRNDPRRIKNSRELSDYINKIGFLPFFKSNIEGYSVEELTAADGWWSGNQDEDPWEWRGIIAQEGKIAYGKLFSGKAGFVSKEWFPIFSVYRRNGYDFDSRYEDGLASRKHKNIIDLLTTHPTLPSYELKAKAGFGKEGEKGFDGAMNALQMQTYILVNGFHRKRNKQNEEYGWAVAEYILSEKLFGEDYVRSAYHMDIKEAKDKMMQHLMKVIPNASMAELEKLLK